MPRNASQQKRLRQRLFNLMYSRLTIEEQEALDDIYDKEFNRLTNQKTLDQNRPYSKAHWLALDESAQTLQAWLEDGIVPFRVMILSDRPELLPKEINKALIDVPWSSYIRSLVVDNFNAAFEAGIRWAASRDIRSMPVRSGFAFWQDMLSHAHAMLVLHSGSNPFGRKIQKAKKAGLWVVTRQLPNILKSKEKINGSSRSKNRNSTM